MTLEEYLGLNREMTATGRRGLDAAWWILVGWCFAQPTNVTHVVFVFVASKSLVAFQIFTLTISSIVETC